METNKSYDEEIRQLWRETAIAVARAEGSRSKETPANWANHMVTEYIKAFPKRDEKQD